jgi:hypothetical protein
MTRLLTDAEQLEQTMPRPERSKLTKTARQLRVQATDWMMQLKEGYKIGFKKRWRPILSEEMTQYALGLELESPVGTLNLLQAMLNPSAVSCEVGTFQTSVLQDHTLTIDRFTHPGENPRFVRITIEPITGGTPVSRYYEHQPGDGIEYLEIAEIGQNKRFGLEIHSIDFTPDAVPGRDHALGRFPV